MYIYYYTYAKQMYLKKTMLYLLYIKKIVCTLFFCIYINVQIYFWIVLS
jgi:hypothetical protein